MGPSGRQYRATGKSLIPRVASGGRFRTALIGNRARKTAENRFRIQPVFDRVSSCTVSGRRQVSIELPVQLRT